MKNLLLISAFTTLVGISASSLTDFITPGYLVENNESLASTSQPIILPLEVMGEDGTTISVQIQAEDAGRVNRIYIKAHSISYPAYLGYNKSKASIRLNGGKWVDVTNKNVECFYPEKEYGCTKGPYASIRFWIRTKELGKFKNGVNRIDFRFNYVNGDISSGYRILELDLINKGGYSAVKETEIQYEDPTSWIGVVADR